MNRIHAFDRIRFFAICCVILLHTVSGVSDTVPFLMTAAQYRVYKCIEALCACGVPLFLMISGALLLAPEKEIPFRDLWKKYIRRMLLVILVFGTLFSLAELCASHGAFDAALLLPALKNALTGNTWAHMWYPYLMVFIYLLTPPLKRFAKTADRTLWRIVLFLMFALLTLYPAITQAAGLFGLPRLPSFLVFVFYYLFGCYAYMYLRDAGRQPVVLLICGLSAAAVLWLVLARGVTDMDYDAPLIAVFAACLFLLFLSVEKPGALYERLAPYVFGMYITHAVLINLLYKGFGLSPLLAGGYVLIPVFFVSAFLFALAASYLLRRIPVVRHYML